MAIGVLPGSASQSGSRVTIAPRISVTVSPANAGRPTSISYSDASKCPDVGAVIDGLAARLFRAHVHRSAQNHSGLGHRVIVGD